MKKLMMLSLMLMGFTQQAPAVFDTGDCALFVDQPGKLDKSMVVRIEGYRKGHYVYRWWMLQGGWSVELGKLVWLSERHEFEKMFQKATCPTT